jgi:arylsulfatase A-like enzyme
VNRRRFLQTATASAACAGSKENTKPNVLLIVTDDQRADTIAALGNRHIITPNLDRLARRSVVFRNAYCMGGNNGAVCTPSRNMLFSGRAYTRYGLLASASQPNFPDAMREAGYETYHHGKRGNSATEIQARFETCKYIHEEAARRSGVPGRIIAEDAIAFVRERKPGSKPFFLSLAFEAPHDPRTPEPRDADYYAKNPPPLPRNFLPVHPFDNGEMEIRDELLAPWPRTREEIQRQLIEYYAVITGLDRQIGRILRQVEEASAANGRGMIVIFTSDQGLALGSHGLLGKQSLYDAAMRSPLLISAPGITPGTSNALAYLFDLFPTVLDLIGVQRPPGLDGLSLAPCLSRKSHQVRQHLYLGYKACQRAVRDGRYKLIVYPDIHKRQLFDLQADPDEMRDLSAEPRYAARIDAMLVRLKALQQQFGDTLPLAAPQPSPAQWTPPKTASRGPAA